MARPEKFIITSARYISVAMSYLLRQDMKLFFTNSVSSSDFAYSATVKPRPSTRLYWHEIVLLLGNRFYLLTNLLTYLLTYLPTYLPT